MEARFLSTLTSLSGTQVTALKKGKILTIDDLFLTPPADLQKKCNLIPTEIESLLSLVSGELAHQPRALEDTAKEGEEKFTTGDPALDEAFGGGVRTGMLWEVVGESAAGKTQLALQLSLLVQLPQELGGVSGSACILTTSAHLPTTRLVEITDTHPLLSPSLCSLSDIHTIKTPEISILLRVLSSTLPTFVAEQASKDDAKPVKLLVIDALTELFHSDSRTSSSTLQQRSRNLSEISSLLHALARQHGLAVLVLNEVIDAFGAAYDADTGSPGELLYRDQARLFGRADSLPGEGHKEAALGLVWANQVNIRIMMSRTGRCRSVDDLVDARRKRRRLANAPDGGPRTGDQLTLVRRLSVIFSCVAPTVSLDYVVCNSGIVTIPEERTTPEPPPRGGKTSSISPPLPTALPIPKSDDVSPYDVSLIADDEEGPSSSIPLEELTGLVAENAEAEDGPREEDEWDQYWKEDDGLYKLVESEGFPSIKCSTE